MELFLVTHSSPEPKAIEQSQEVNVKTANMRMKNCPMKVAANVRV